MPGSSLPPGRARSGGAPRPRGKSAAPARGAKQSTEATHFRSRSERAYELPSGVSNEIRSGGDSSTGRPRRRTETLERMMTSAAVAYERDMYQDALPLVKAVVQGAPGSAAARELYGLVLYRLGRWRQAARELRQFHSLSGSYDQHPVIADCERALGNHNKVRELWDELRRAGVDREVLTEGRLVMAGTLADEGNLGDAIELLRPDAKPKNNPDLAHLRTWYALADLYEKAGDLPRARELFARVARAAPDVLDAPERLAALR